MTLCSFVCLIAAYYVIKKGCNNCRRKPYVIAQHEIMNWPTLFDSVDLQTSRIMFLLSLLGALGHASGAAIEPCCLEKNVGGVDYVLWDENTGMTSGYGCLQDCIYVRFVHDLIFVSTNSWYVSLI